MKKFVLLFAIILSACSQQTKQERSSFEWLMGKDTEQWEYISTNLDQKYLKIFEDLYLENNHNSYLAKEKKKIAHYIWLGPHAFPAKSIENVKKFISLHPGWEVYFWTDRKTIPPDHRMQVKYIEQYPFSQLKTQYYLSRNYGEKSDLLRYEILWNLGGIYLDHDVEVFASLDKLYQTSSLFCGIEPPHEPILHSAISVCNNIIGSEPFHPILASCIEKVQSNWQSIEEAFPSDDKDSVIYRVAYRTFGAFDEAIREAADHKAEGLKVFPANYFNTIKTRKGLYANHTYAGNWYKEEDPFKDLVRKTLNKLAKKSNQMLLITSVTLLCTLCLMVYVLWIFRTWKKQKED